MTLNITINGKRHPVEVPESLLNEADDFFRKIDRDMDRGYQMSRQWVERPSVEQRCQIVADRILTAVHQKNRALVGLGSAYILKHMPGVSHVRIDTSGDMTQTLFEFGERPEDRPAN